MLMVFIMTPYMRIRHKIEGIEGNRPLRAEEIRFGFDQVSAGCPLLGSFRSIPQKQGRR